MIKSKLLSMCICPALLAPPAVIAVHKPTRHAVARTLHRVADNLDKTPRVRAAPLVQYASLPCEPVLAGGPGSLLDASLPGGIGGPGLAGLAAFATPDAGRSIAYADGPSLVGGGGFTGASGGGGGNPGGAVPVPPEVAGVPEPESWAFMIAGLGIVGGVMRYRRVAAA